MYQRLNILKTFLTTIPLISAGFYLFGVCSHQGFLKMLGIEETLFPLSVDRILYQGFSSLITISVTPFSYSFLGVLILFSVSTFIAFIFSNDYMSDLGRSVIAKLRSFRKAESKARLSSSFLDKVFLFCFYFLFIFGIYFALLIIGTIAERSGKEQAISFIKNSTINRNGFVTLYPFDKSSSVNGWPIICNLNYCAYWLGTEAIILRHDSLDRIIFHSP